MDALDAIEAELMIKESTVEKIPHLGQFLAEWPREPFRYWCLGETRATAIAGLRTLVRIRRERRLP